MGLRRDDLNMKVYNSKQDEINLEVLEEFVKGWLKKHGALQVMEVAYLLGKEMDIYISSVATRGLLKKISKPDGIKRYWLYSIHKKFRNFTVPFSSTDVYLYTLDEDGLVKRLNKLDAGINKVVTTRTQQGNEYSVNDTY